MQNIITLLSQPGSTKFAAILDIATSTLKELQATIGQPIWLSPDEACDLAFDGISSTKASEALEVSLRHLPCDFIAQPVLHRKKKLLICDMDSTIIQQECIDELADALGLKDKVAAITERAMNGELVFEDALKERVALLKGLTTAQLQQVYTTQITLMPGAKTLVQTMKNHGHPAILVSGGFTFFTQQIADIVGFTKNFANILEIENHKLTGQVIEPILGKEAKVTALLNTIKDLNLEHNETLAIGDGANDIPMLETAGLGIAYRAKLAVRKKISHHINNTDLTSVLYIQGYARDQITYVG